MNDKQKKSLQAYLAFTEGQLTIDGFQPEIGDRRDEPTYVGYVICGNGFKLCMGIEPDGSRHT